MKSVRPVMSVTMLAMQFSSMCLMPIAVVCSCVLMVSGLPFQYESTRRSAAIRTKVGVAAGSMCGGWSTDVWSSTSDCGKATVRRALSALALVCVWAPPTASASGSSIGCSLLSSGSVLDEVGFDAASRKPALPAT